MNQKSPKEKKALLEQMISEGLVDKAKTPNVRGESSKPTGIDSNEGDVKTPDQQKSEIKTYIYSLVSRREYSRREVKEKLSKKQFDEMLSGETLDECVNEDIVSDKRYMDMLIRSRQSKANGPNRLRQELSQKGVSDILISDGINENDQVWNELALKALKKKYKGIEAPEFEQKAKLIRFLNYRGFSRSHIDFALEHLIDKSDY